MELRLTRGDTHKITFRIKTTDGGSYILENQDKLYFTIKRGFYFKEFVLQKTSEDGITYNSQTQQYEITLNNTCTCDLKCDNYVYDIKLIMIEEGKRIDKTLAKGNLILEPNATHKENE